MEASERTSRSCHVRDSWLGYQVAVLAHLAVGRAGGGGHESGLAEGREKMFLRQVRRLYWKTWAAKHECVELKDGLWLEPIQACCEERDNMDTQAPTCDEEVGTGSRLGGEKIVRHCSVRRTEMSKMSKKEARRSTQIVSLPVLEGGQKT